MAPFLFVKSSVISKYMYLAAILAARSLIESLRQKSVRLIDDQVVRISRHDLRMNKTGRVSFKACD